jgi:hypothetical protein
MKGENNATMCSVKDYSDSWRNRDALLTSRHLRQDKQVSRVLIMKSLYQLSTRNIPTEISWLIVPFLTYQLHRLVNMNDYWENNGFFLCFLRKACIRKQSWPIFTLRWQSVRAQVCMCVCVCGGGVEGIYTLKFVDEFHYGLHGSNIIHT